MKLNRKLEIGINAVNVLKTRTEVTKVSDMAAEVGTTVFFLEQVMRNLRKAGIVSVKRGPGGGYILNKEVAVNAFQVAEAVGSAPGTKMSLDGTPMNRLQKALVNAFLTTAI